MNAVWAAQTTASSGVFLGPTRTARFAASARLRAVWSRRALATLAPRRASPATAKALLGQQGQHDRRSMQRPTESTPLAHHNDYCGGRGWTVSSSLTHLCWPQLDVTAISSWLHLFMELRRRSAGGICLWALCGGLRGQPESRARRLCRRGVVHRRGRSHSAGFPSMSSTWRRSRGNRTSSSIHVPVTAKAASSPHACHSSFCGRAKAQATLPACEGGARLRRRWRPGRFPASPGHGRRTDPLSLHTLGLLSTTTTQHLMPRASGLFHHCTHSTPTLENILWSSVRLSGC